MFNGADDFILGEWNDYSCENVLPSVCKGPANAVKPPPPEEKCKLPDDQNKDFVPFDDDTCFWVSTEKMAWHDAERDCKSKGAELTSILDWTEQNKVLSLTTEERTWIGVSHLKVNTSTILKKKQKGKC